MGDETEAAKASRAMARSLADGDPTGWFEKMYTSAARGEVEMPWDRPFPTPTMVDWFDSDSIDRRGTRAVVVGCGYGRDAEYLASRGLETTAFDISETALQTAIERHPGSAVEYVAADLLNPPVEWRRAFDFVMETTTVQSLPIAMHRAASAAVSDLVAPGGTLLVTAYARDVTDDPESAPDPVGPPWPLTRSEIEAFATNGVELVQLEQLTTAPPWDRQWRAEFRRPAT